MKVLLVNKFHFMKGGAETYYFTLAEALKRAGHSVIFFSMKHEKNLPCDEEKYFVEKKEYNEKTNAFDKIKAFKSIVYSKEAYSNISKLIEDEKPDVAFLNNVHRQLTTSVVDALHNHKIRIIWVVHDLIMLCPNYQMLDGKGMVCEECCKGKYKNCIKKKCVKQSYLKSFLAYKEAVFNKKHRTYEKIDLFITPSLFYRNKLIEYHFNADKVIYVPNPLSFGAECVTNVLDEHYFLYFGRLSREKGIDLLINALKDIEYKLLIVGSGPMEDELKRLAADSENIKFKGFQTGEILYDYIKKSRCVVLPSQWYENGPYSAMEAMSFGKPLIVSNMGGLPELVENGINGFVFQDVDSLKDALKRMIELDDDAYRSMSVASCEKAKKMFDANNYLQRIGFVSPTLKNNEN